MDGVMRHVKFFKIIVKLKTDENGQFLGQHIVWCISVERKICERENLAS